MPKIQVEAYGITDTGLRRDRNEDALAILPEQGMFIVADGIGGASGGDVASEVATTVVPLKLETRLAKLRRNAAKTKVEAVVLAVFQEINDALVKEAEKRLAGEGTGTTIVLSLNWKGSALIAHLGDSRAYLWRNGALTRLTEDHSLAAQLVRWGKIAESQAEKNPGSSTLLRYLGADEELDPGFTWVKLLPEDHLLLCSDGLTRMVSDDGIASILASSDALETCCQRLVDRANRAGGKDNITAVVVRFRQVINGSAKANELEEKPS